MKLNYIIHFSYDRGQTKPVKNPLHSQDNAHVEENLSLHFIKTNKSKKSKKTLDFTFKMHYCYFLNFHR